MALKARPQLRTQLSTSWPAGQDPVECMSRVLKAPPGDGRTGDLKALAALAKSGEVRDFSFTPEFYHELFALIAAGLSWRAKEVQGDVLLAEQFFLDVSRVQEFSSAATQEHVDDELVRAIVFRADGQATQEEWPLLRSLLLWAYAGYSGRRAQLRGLVGRLLRNASSFMHKSSPVQPLLGMLVAVIRGFGSPLSQVHRSLLLDILLPLHKTNEWLQWDRQTPMLAMYHKELVRCMMLFLEKDPSLSVRCVEALCSYFPGSREANTPKEVLIIYEISQVLRFVDVAAFPQVLPVLLRQMTRLLSSHNAQPLQSVLQYWKDDHIAQLFQVHASQLIPPLLPVLLRGGEPFWNPTVNRMTSLVLEKMEKSDPDLFRQSAEDLWGPGRSRPTYITAREAEAAAVALAAKEEAEEKSASSKPADVSSLKYCLGGWKPPAASGGGTSGKAPPLTATGVAPWAMGGGARGGPVGGKQPPLTATGVAPWAFKGAGAPPRPGPLSSIQGGGLGGTSGPTKPPERGSISSLQPCREDVAEEPAQEASGLDRVYEYLKVLSPDASSEAGAGAQLWETALMAETPTLLPDLKFHQLVFGAEDLASGAFSVVRYARSIVKDKTQSQWPEYAVKVINTKTIQEHGYEASVNREICVLKMLSHPGIARMVSAFRWRDGAYLVLEYASKGDLHTILVQQGKLPEDTARFFLGETIAALAAIHEAGLLYGDLKPENIVITTTSHAKLTDFGGCRPVTEEARQRTKLSLLRRLRDGDWRAKDAQPDEAAEPAEDEVAAAADDGRAEGTTMYLPPEVVRGGRPTLATDAWALGCLQFQLLTGKPPIWVESESEEELRSRIVGFQWTDDYLDILSEQARKLVSRLLEPDVVKRLPVAGAASDQFFQGMDVFRLYAKPRGPEIAAAQRSANPEGDERWQKRQFSKIWSVMPSPEDYQMPTTNASGNGDGIKGLSIITNIEETALEALAPFLDEVLADGMPFARTNIESI